MRIREWADQSDTSAMQQLSSRQWPAGPHPGGLGWSQSTGQLAKHVVLAEHEGLAGWAGVSQPGTLLLQVDTERPDATNIAAELIGWLLETADGPGLAVEVFDDVIREALVVPGFEHSPTPDNFYGLGALGLQVDVDQLPDLPASAAGYDVRSVRLDEAPERVAVHRAAWKPSDLPFHPDRRPHLEPEWTSSFHREDYERVRQTWLYDPEFDLVAVAPDGSLAACCIGWFDTATGWAEIEPLGVIPDHRGRGLAGSLCAAMAYRVANAGGQHLFINTGPSAAYPAPYGAYRKAGFTSFARSESFRLMT